MLPRLERRLNLLTGGARDRAARQQTLRGTIAWSYELLPPGERQLLARLAVFAGGCSFDAADAVCTHDGALAVDLLDGLDALVEHSLLRQDESAADPRFRMLATIREFATDQLEERGEKDAMQRAHADFFLTFAEEGKKKLIGPDQGEWLQRIDAEHDNLRTALSGMLERLQPDLMLRLAGSLWRFWIMRGHLTEGRKWLDQALAHRDGIESSIVADALDGAGGLARAQGDSEQATAALEDALRHRRASQDYGATAATLSLLGSVAHFQNDFERARTYFEEAANLAREAGDKRTQANAVSYMGDGALLQGDLEKALVLFNEGLGLFRAIGDRRGEGNNLTMLGNLSIYKSEFAVAVGYLEQSCQVSSELNDTPGIALVKLNLAEALRHVGESGRAEGLCSQAIEIARELGSKDLAALAHNISGKLSLARGAIEDARALLTKSFDLSLQSGDKQLTADCLEALGGVSAVREMPAEAASLFGAAEALREAIGVPLQEAYRCEIAPYIRATETRLTAEAFAAAWACGRSMTPEEIARSLGVIT